MPQGFVNRDPYLCLIEKTAHFYIKSPLQINLRSISDPFRVLSDQFQVYFWYRSKVYFMQNLLVYFGSISGPIQALFRSIFASKT